MKTDEAAATYRVWGADHISYGPVDLPTLIDWVKDDRVTTETWIFLDLENQWVKASEMPELRLFLKPQTGDITAPTPAEQAGVKPGNLRRLKLFATMNEPQLESFLRYMEVVRCRRFSTLVRSGDQGDAMFVVLEGEVRARVLIDDKETTLMTMTIGEFFGEISLLDQGPRSADVLANQDSILLKISAPAFEQMMSEAPALATPFLFNLSRSVVGRIRVLTKRYQDSIHFSRTAGSPLR